MLRQSRDTKDPKQSHAKLSWSLSIGLGERHEDKTLFAGEGVFHELNLPIPHQLFVAMCGVMLEAVPFAVRIGFLSSIGAGLPRPCVPTPFPRLRYSNAHFCLCIFPRGIPNHRAHKCGNPPKNKTTNKNMFCCLCKLSLFSCKTMKNQAERVCTNCFLAQSVSIGWVFSWVGSLPLNKSMNCKSKCLGEGPKAVNSHKWLGEGAKGLLGRGSENLPRVWGTLQNPFYSVATPFCTSARCFRSLAPTDLLHPLVTSYVFLPSKNLSTF